MSKNQQKIKRLIEKLESSSILGGIESVKEVFFPVKMGNDRYYGLITPNHLILIKKTYFEPKKLDFIPFEEIEEVVLSSERRKNFLILAIVCISFIFVLLFLESYFSWFTTPMISILMGLNLALISVIMFYSLYRFIKGEAIIRLENPKKNIILHPSFRGLRLNKITFYKFSGQTLKLEEGKGNMSDLYILLKNYSKR